MKWFSLLFLPAVLFSNPEGARVSHGHAHVSHHGPQMRIETSHHAVIHWDSFSIASGEATRFVQPCANSTVINRVSQGVSNIEGALLGNGRIYLLNPNGVLVGKSGIVSCAAFAASTLDFDSNSCFKGGELLFKGDSQEKIINFGKIEATGGDVFLLARAVINEGVIEAKEGVVGVAAAREVLLKPEGNQRIYIAPQVEEAALVENSGVIEATRAELRANGNVYRLAINQSGVIEATGLREEGGQIVLVAEGGEVKHSGTLLASSGSIHLLGGDVSVQQGAIIDVSGPCGGGEVLLGGDYQGGNPEILNACNTIVEMGSLIDARATEFGDGGRVIVWGEQLSSFEGKIDACGGSFGGNGGFVEVSSPGFLNFNGFADLRAERGNFGELLLDPSDVTISTNANSFIFFDAGESTYKATASTANLNTTTLATALNAGNVTVTTKSDFLQFGDITLENALSWTAPTTLTLQSDRDVVATSTTNLSAFNGSLDIRAGRDFTVPSGATFTVGRIEISAIQDIDLQSGAVPCIFLGNNLVFNSGGESSFIPVMGDLELIASGGSIEFNQLEPERRGGGITFGSTSSQGHITVVADGHILLRSGGDLNVIGSNASNFPVLIYANSEVSRFLVGGDVLIQGGGGANSSARLGTGAGQINFEVGGNIQILGGAGNGSDAHLGHFRILPETEGSGTLFFGLVGGDLRVIGGSGTAAFAHLGTRVDSAAPTWDFSGDIFLEDIRGGVEVVSNTGAAIIGFGDSPIPETYQGTLRLRAQKDVVVTATNAVAGIGAVASQAASFSAELRELFIKGQNIILTAGNGQNATIGFQSTDVTTTASVSIRKIEVDALGTIVLNPGINTGNLNGASLIGTYTAEGTAGSSILIKAEDVILNGSSGVNGGFGRIVATSNAPGSIPTDIEIRTKNLDVGLSGSVPFTAEIYGGGQILVLAEDNVTLRGPSWVHTDSGDITLVADYNESDPFKIGNGSFSIFSPATLTSGGALRIFTSKRENTFIGASLNGANYVPGPLYVDSDTEQWGSVYPDGFGGFPFTLFYKTALSRTLWNEANQIFGEMFQKLHTYDELLFACKCFLFGYDKACYDQLFHPKGMVSSFDLFSEERRCMLRQKYRNYELKYVESF